MQALPVAVLWRPGHSIIPSPSPAGAHRSPPPCVQNRGSGGPWDRERRPGWIKDGTWQAELPSHGPKPLPHPTPPPMLLSKALFL